MICEPVFGGSPQESDQVTDSSFLSVLGLPKNGPLEQLARVCLTRGMAAMVASGNLLSTTWSLLLSHKLQLCQPQVPDGACLAVSSES
jgi:hypothetical protein